MTASGVPRPRPTNGGGDNPARIVETYPYTDEQGVLLFEVVRLEPKDFRQRAPDGAGGWTWKTKGIRRPIFRLQQVQVAAAAGVPIWVVEGEKDVIALESAGAVATCNPGGAGKGKWLLEHSLALSGAKAVYIVGDKDEPGRAHAQGVARSLAGMVGETRILEAIHGKDAAEALVDWEPGGELSSRFEAVALEAPDDAKEGDAQDPTFSGFDWIQAGAASHWIKDGVMLEPPPREYLFDQFIPKGIVGILAGEGGVGKGHLTTAMCIAGATGLRLGPFVPPPGRSSEEANRPWIFIGKEDDRDEQHRRLFWAVRMWDPMLTPEQLERLGENLFIPSIRTGMKLGNELIDTVGDFVAKSGRKPACSLLDPMSRFWDSASGLQMNSQEGAGWAHEWLGALQEATGGNVVTSHHASKEGRKDAAKGRELDATAITGSAQLVDLARWVGILAPMGVKEARENGWEGRQIVTLSAPKSNYTAKTREPFHFERKEGGALSEAKRPTTLVGDSKIVEGYLRTCKDGALRGALIKSMKDGHSMSRRRSEAAILTLKADSRIYYQGARNSGEMKIYAGVNPNPEE